VPPRLVGPFSLRIRARRGGTPLFVATLNRTGVISMARPMVESRFGRVTAAAIDAVMSEGFPAKRMVRGSR
jgi:hypothetical protein